MKLLNSNQGAIEGFNTYAEEFNEGDFRPHALLMLVKSHKALGETEKARSYFGEIEKKYRNTEIYSDAADEMKTL